MDCTLCLYSKENRKELICKLDFREEATQIKIENSSHPKTFKITRLDSNSKKLVL